MVTSKPKQPTKRKPPVRKATQKPRAEPEEPPQKPRKVEIAAPKFDPGMVVTTPAVANHLSKHNETILPYLGRHIRGDWGELSQPDRDANDVALVKGFRILSSYMVAGRLVWIITDSDRIQTTIMFPNEYVA